MKFCLIKNSLRRASAIAMGVCAALVLAACGGGGGSPGTVSGSSGSTNTDVGSVSLIFSSPELKSAGAAGTEVTITAQVKNASNNALADVPVTFTADSGALTGVDTATDKNGQAKATLGISGDHTNRTITVTVRAGTSSVNKTASGTVDVVGTTVNIAGPGTISTGGTGDFTITVKDSANVAVANVPVSFSSQKGNPIAVKSSGGGTATAPRTNSQGQVVLTLTANQTGSDTLLVSSQGANASAAVNVNAAKLTLNFVDSNNNVVTYFDANGNELQTANTGTSCLKIAAHYDIGGVPQNGTVNINTSRGRLYSDAACSTALSSSSVPLSNGNANATYLKSDTAGVATVTASISGGPTAQVNVEFVAQLTPAATITLQAEPAIIGANTGSGQSEKSTLTAIVRDGTSNNNFVKNAVVEFSIVQDQSGGFLSNPSVVTTASNGTASVVFVAGTATTATNGVIIQAKIQGTSTTATVPLTVAKKSLFISAGTGNKIGTPSTSTYQQDYAVFVTDAAGNPVQGVAVTASVWPTQYRKGFYSFNSATKVWEPTVNATCPNEDSNKNGILDGAAEDTNSNGVLDPGIPVTISSSGTTDANGTATISLLYPRDRAGWIEAQVTIHGSVSGTESTYITSPYILPGSSSDFSDEKTPPPGLISPYGTNACNVAN
ncbi:MAG TPA: Ig-like domain-containing protein [Noviherbaspirillum sp.]